MPSQPTQMVDCANVVKVGECTCDEGRGTVREKEECTALRAIFRDDYKGDER